MIDIQQSEHSIPPYKMWCYDGGSHWWANTVLFDVLIISVYHSIYSSYQTWMNKPLLIWALWCFSVRPQLQREMSHRATFKRAERWWQILLSIIFSAKRYASRFHNPQFRILWSQYSTKIELIHALLSSLPLGSMLPHKVTHFRFMLEFNQLFSGCYRTFLYSFAAYVRYGCQYLENMPNMFSRYYFSRQGSRRCIEGSIWPINV